MAEFGEIDEATADLIRLLADRGETLSAAESLTAGLFCATVASVPGASAVLRGGVVTYATDVKHLLADVDLDVLEEFGPVAEITARHMALGVSRRVRSDWAVSLTGVAGPSMQDGHPVGEVWCGIKRPGDDNAADVLVTRLPIGAGLSRNQIRSVSVELAVEALVEQIRYFRH
nr:nicotinamide-nucleotide amidohydrolase family protein [Corynebacterium lactis]